MPSAACVHVRSDNTFALQAVHIRVILLVLTLFFVNQNTKPKKAPRSRFWLGAQIKLQPNVRRVGYGHGSNNHGTVW